MSLHDHALPGRPVMPILTAWELTLLRSVASGLPDHEVDGGLYRRVARRWSDAPGLVRFRALCHILADLLDQGWRFQSIGGAFALFPAGGACAPGESPSDVKARLRAALQIGRDRQLAEPSVQAFLRKMEAGSSLRRPISELISDGADLVDRIVRAKRTGGDDPLAHVLDPELSVCDTHATCPHTGIRLLDIWRYFRHSWSLEYRPVPGRTLPLLIRNRALPRHPVMGIAMLASPVMKMRERDAWLGLSLESFERDLATQPQTADRVLEDLLCDLDTAIGEIRSDDLIDARQLATPDDDVILSLQRKAAGAKAEHEHLLKTRRDAGGGVVRGVDGEDVGDIDWIRASEDPLFVRKRAETLAQLLSARQVLQSCETGEALLIGMLERPVRRAVQTVLKERLKTTISSQVMDLSVCGAVAPYGPLTTGKLVALLATSREAISLVDQRYSGQPSLIASQMAGRCIAKSGRLRALTTTSLYGVGSSQYNRLKLKAECHEGLDRDLRWELIANTDGFGSIHLSSDTVESLRAVSEAEHGIRRINSRFGEGTSPRMRQIREGLDALGLNPDHILRHATPRKLYGCRLPDGPLDDLPKSDDIARAWRTRWAEGRTDRADVLSQVAAQSFETLRASIHSDTTGQFRLPLTR